MILGRDIEIRAARLRNQHDNRFATRERSMGSCSSACKGIPRASCYHDNGRDISLDRERNEIYESEGGLTARVRGHPG